MGTHTKTEVPEDLDILQVKDLVNKFPFRWTLHIGHLFVPSIISPYSSKFRSTLGTGEMGTRVCYNDPVLLQIFGANTAPHGLHFIQQIMYEIWVFLTVLKK